MTIYALDRWVLALGLVALISAPPDTIHANSAESSATTEISPDEVAAAQHDWGKGIVAIGRAYTDGGFDAAREAAEAHIDRLYAYEMGAVLFKPTLASVDQFRTNRKEALSYFVGGDVDHDEDKGFALRPWKQVRWENIGTQIADGMAVAMGNYYFTPADGAAEVKVEYSFGYVRGTDGRLRIALHDSSLPYRPES